MFNFSANHLLLLSRMEYRTCVVFLMKDDSTRRVYRLYDFTKSQIITSDHYYCVSGKVNSADKLPGYRVGQEGHHTQPGPAVYASSGRRGRSALELIIRLGKNSHRDCLSSYGGRRIRVLRDHRQALWLTSTPAKTGSLLNRR